MTPPATAGTSISPSAHRLWSRARGLLLALAVLLLAGTTLAVLRSGERHGLLDPRSADRQGSRAVAELLADRGVRTEPVTTTADAVAAARPGTTLLVTNPDLLTKGQRTALRNAMAGPDRRTVLLAPGASATRDLAPAAEAAEPTTETPLSPDCDYPPAHRAGDAELGGLRYTLDEAAAPGADQCYLSDGLPALLRLPGPEGGDTVLLGAPDLLLNDRLAERGNASLALQLLGSQPRLVWYLPSLGDAAPDGGDRDFFELLPAGWGWAAAQLGVAALLAAVWRARRLGPLTLERLPVTIRAAEATEGRARLYHHANARDRAAETLRSATRSRLAPVVGVPVARAHRPEALCPPLAAHAGRTATDLTGLLFGPAPQDDRELISLAEELDRLQHTVTSATSSVSGRPPTPPPAESRTPGASVSGATASDAADSVSPVSPPPAREKDSPS
ncbi:DUF4350 domain-containing protein [Streptomyces zingiberis]|uniref:DUF4350 domain-containing protein n=1 Tax=Streptomyces zingiberis TaxID=2053010 RepID=A0ABX1C483_9ACTN|nr:DUF4350 domain-containing protein [Streptomyces zingiberis]NJQ01744.1 DUF4350 domain-containing protein [Streptomyces zingiberis]